MRVSTILDHIDSGHMALPEFHAGMSGTAIRSEGSSIPCTGATPSVVCWSGRPSRRLRTTAARPCSPLEL